MKEINQKKLKLLLNSLLKMTPKEIKANGLKEIKKYGYSISGNNKPNSL
jgi:hypothetical protein